MRLDRGLEVLPRAYTGRRQRGLRRVFCGWCWWGALRWRPRLCSPPRPGLGTVSAGGDDELGASDEHLRVDDPEVRQPGFAHGRGCSGATVGYAIATTKRAQGTRGAFFTAKVCVRNIGLVPTQGLRDQRRVERPIVKHRARFGAGGRERDAGARPAAMVVLQVQNLGPPRPRSSRVPPIGTRLM